MNYNCKKNEIARHCWETDHNFNLDQKKVVDIDSRLIPRKMWIPITIVLSYLSMSDPEILTNGTYANSLFLHLQCCLFNYFN